MNRSIPPSSRGSHRPRHSRRPASRRPLARLRGQDGNALVEFVVLSAALLIPSLYLVLTLASVQSAVFAADLIARDTARIHATVSDPDRAEIRAREHTRMILEDFGLGAHDVAQIRCSHDPCATPGGDVTALVSIPVPVPGLGPVLGRDGPVSVSAAHAAPVDQYRAVP